MKKTGVVWMLLWLLLWCSVPSSVLAQPTDTEQAPAESTPQEGDTEAFPQMDFAPQGASAVLMDASTGTVLYESNGDEEREPASVTKIMTMALVMEELLAGNLQEEDMVTASEYAKSMGGSQIYLDAGEQMSVYDLMKSVALASANDSTVALAEHIAGSEDAFVQRMNDKAAELGMEHTQFTNPHGLPEEGHYSSAYDIALMSRYLLSLEGIEEYIACKTYPIREGEREYLMVNSNKLLQSYEGCIGIKTGFTDQAKYCLSGAARRNGLTLIAVVMGEETIAQRNEDVAKMLDWGFANFESYTVTPNPIEQTEVPVKLGLQESVKFWAPMIEIPSQIVVKGHEPVVEQRVVLEESVTAPVEVGDALGSVTVLMDGKEIYTYTFTAVESVLPRDICAAFWLLLKKIITF